MGLHQRTRVDWHLTKLKELTRGGQTEVVECLPFFHVRVPHRDGKNLALGLRALNRYGLLRRLIR